MKRFSKALPSVAGRPRCQIITINAKHKPIVPSSLSSADVSKSYNVPIIARPPISREPLTLKSNSPNVKVYSYDDLDIPKSWPKFSPTSFSRRDRRSTSTSESFEPLGWLNEVTSPAEPMLPFFPPPVRSPTPPGLPSFGSLAALSYVPPRRHRASKGRSTRHGQSPRIGNRVRSFARDDEGSDSRDVLTSFLTGIGRLFNIIPPATPPSERLPPGIVARADDGTYIRARFGHRHSGHGVGAGSASIGLESHPFHRRTLATARTSNQANSTGVPGRNAQNRNGDTVNRPQTVYRYPPYRSMLDVPAPKKRSAPRRAPSIDPPAATPGPSSSGNPAFNSADTRRGQFEPGLSEIRENPKSPPRPPPGYSAPVNMEFSMDGRGDDGEGSNPPGPPPPAPPSPTAVPQDGEEVVHNDEPYFCSCVSIKNILAGCFKRSVKPCRSGCSAPSLEELHTVNPDLRGHVNRRPSNETHDTNTHSDTQRNTDHPNIGNTSGDNSGHTADHVAGDTAANGGTNEDANHSDDADSTETVKPVRAADNPPSEQEPGPSTQPRDAISPRHKRSTWPFSGR